MGPTNGGIVETPTLDIETPGILQRVSEEGGGYTFARMAAAARDGDARAAEVAREMAWEQLHCGPWHSVLPIWRDAYSMACLHVAKHHFAGGDFSETIRVLDLGLIMGGTLLRVDLENAVDKVMAVLEERENGSNNGEGSDNGGGLLFSSADFNEAEVLRSLPANSLSSKLVARRSGLSLEGFLRDYFLMGLPVIISDSMSHWPARARWNNMEYLKRVAGGRTVPVEIKELRKDILVPDYCYAGGGELRSINAWFGPAGTVTPLHHDPHHNLLAQVVGKKYVRLYAASLSEELYPHSETMLRNSSQIDLDDIDDNAFPKVRDLEFMDCILDEGDMLYIPPKWWHYVRSLTPSLSVSFWWSNPEGSP
uniref:JmjC domain-containing protein n=1 Tax=Chenopodium quinoa TaxID=63459 RepID=A0A803NC66_CHEQI